MPDVHSIFSPSGASRWMKCLGSIQLSERIPDTTSVYAAEGTAAHTVCERSLAMGMPCSALIGEKIGEFEVTAEMADHCQVYVDFVNSRMEEFPETEMLQEERIVADWEPRFGGTIDCLMRNSDRDALGIVDFKYGVGIPVEAEGNKQLLCYALLAWRGEEFISAAIIQPRCEHPDGPVRKWQISAAELTAFRQELESIMGRIDDLAEDDADTLPLVTGDHCRWCKAQAACPQQYKEVVKEALNDFAPVESLPDDQRLLIMNRMSQINAYLKAVEESLTSSMLTGDRFPGWKLVQALGNRKWKLKDEELLKKLKNRKIKRVDCTATVVKSPAQMEKIKGIDKEWLSRFMTRDLSGPKLAPVTDRRPEYEPPRPEDDFDPLEPGTDLSFLE